MEERVGLEALPPEWLEESHPFRRGEPERRARVGERSVMRSGAEIEAALRAGEQLRRGVEELCIAHAASPCGQVTISVGVAALVPTVAQDAGLLIEAADIALYAAKRRGRNTVAAHGAVMLAEAG